MRLRRDLFVAVVLLTALLLQVDVLNAVNLPIGHPDVVVVCVVAFALTGGSQRGAVIGFIAGLALDLIPPADHTAGRIAFAYTVVGYFAGLLEDVEERSILTTVAVVAAGAGAAVLLYAGIGSLIGDPRVTVSATVHSLVAAVVYDVVLAPFVVPLVAGLARRLEPAGPR